MRINKGLNYDLQEFCFDIKLLVTMKKQVPSDSLEWSNIEYQIQLTTGKSSVKLVSVFKFDEKRSETQPEKGWVDAIVNLTDFGKDYCRQVIEYRIPLEDVFFYAGHINIHRYHNQPYKIFTFLICRAHLGKAGMPSTPKLEDCDSVLIEPQVEEEAFQYNFFLKSHKQYQVKYEVSFTVSDDKQFKISEFECCNCENRVPSIYCATEKLYFCEQCCVDHHKTKLMHSHQLEEIDKINTLENCKNHNQKYQFYCLKCEKYLCAMCTQKGIHSQNNEHPVKPIKYLYDETEENIASLPKKSLQKLEVLNYNLKIKRKEIEENYNEVKAQIERDYKSALEMLEEEIAKKYQMLDSCQLQLNMLKDRIQWSRSFSQFQKSSLKPIHYFKSESKFENYIKKLKVSDFEPIFLCKPDLVYESQFRVGQRDLVERISSKNLKNSQFKQNEQVPPHNLNHNPDGHITKNLISYDPNTIPPKRGELSLELENSGLNFFQIKSR